MSKSLLTLLIALALCSRAFAVGTVTSSGTTYDTTEPTTISTGGHGPDSTLDFSSGWDNTEGLTGWDYIGSIADGSFVYLGNGWIITAAHVVSGTSYTGSFTLSGSTYYVVSATCVEVGDSDLTMIYVGDSIDLPSLTLSSSTLSTNATVILVGMGGYSESWGTATVYATGTSVTVSSYTSTDFLALSGSTQLVGGDSGGAAFYYDSTTHSWVLSGILEVSGTATYTSGSTAYVAGCVDISAYYDEIETILQTVPEPAPYALLASGAACLWWIRRRRNNSQGGFHQ